MTKQLLIDESLHLADELVAGAHWHGMECTWISRDLQAAPDPLFKGPVCNTMSPDIYNGLAGVALFLNATLRERPNEAVARTARGAMLRALSFLRPNNDGGPNPYHNPSFYTGATGILWAATEVNSVVGDHVLADEIQAIWQCVHNAKHPSMGHDVLVGSMGAIQPLIQLEERGLEGAHERAQELMDQALNASELKNGRRTWSSIGQGAPGPALNGYSHGASGYALALAADKDSPRVQEALECLAFESTGFDAKRKNWRDNRDLYADTAGQKFMTAWCHGAPGIGLARTRLQALLGDEHRIRQDLEAAMQTTHEWVRQTRRFPAASMTLCHGLFGNSECLLEMASTTDDQKIIQELRDDAVASVERYGAAAKDQWPNNPYLDWPCGRPGYKNYSFFQGLAGIGYYLLRLGSAQPPATLLLPAGIDAVTRSTS